MFFLKSSMKLWQHCILCVSAPGQCVEIYCSKKSSANISTQKIKSVCLFVAHPCCGGYESKYY